MNESNWANARAWKRLQKGIARMWGDSLEDVTPEYILDRLRGKPKVGRYVHLTPEMASKLDREFEKAGQSEERLLKQLEAGVVK